MLPIYFLKDVSAEGGDQQCGENEVLSQCTIMPKVCQRHCPNGPKLAVACNKVNISQHEIQNMSIVYFVLIYLFIKNCHKLNILETFKTNTSTLFRFVESPAYVKVVL